MDEPLGAIVRELADRTEIRELVARYNRTLDDQDVGTVVDMFTADGRLEVKGAATIDPAELGQVYGGVHMTTDAIVEIDGDQATHRCSLIVARRTLDKQAQAFVTTGRYDDELVRTPDGWRFSVRRVETDLTPELVLKGLREPLP